MKFRAIVIISLWFGFLSASDEALAELDNIVLCKSSSERSKFSSRVRILSILKKLEYENIIDIMPLNNLNERNFLFNPSIITTDRGYDIYCRAEAKKGRINQTYILSYDKEFNLLTQHELHLPLDFSEAINMTFPIVDTRLFRWDNETWCTGWSFLKGTSIQKFGVGRLDKFSPIPSTFESLTLFMGPETERWEKNWMPVLAEKKLRFIYSYDPFVLVEPNLDSGEYTTILTYLPKLDFKHFRGSAAPIEFEDGYLMMVHDCLQQRGVRYYTHRFLYLEKNLAITKISLPFTFTGERVEFCLSMTRDHTGKNLVVPIGINDKQAKIILVNIEYVKTLLCEIPY